MAIDDVSILTDTKSDSVRADAWMVFPNPTQGQIGIQLPAGNHEMVAVAVFDPSGKQLLAREFVGIGADAAIDLDLSGLSGGLYFIRIRSGESSYVARVVRW